MTDYTKKSTVALSVIREKRKKIKRERTYISNNGEVVK